MRLWWPRTDRRGLRAVWGGPGVLCSERVPLAAVSEACWAAVVWLGVCRRSQCTALLSRARRSPRSLEDGAGGRQACGLVS